jgi:hypothetical protein
MKKLLITKIQNPSSKLQIPKSSFQNIGENLNPFTFQFPRREITCHFFKINFNSIPSGL